jgi:hypothetical protein
MTYFIIGICQPYSSVLEVHVKWFLNELLVSLIMPLLSSKSVDEKINNCFFNWLSSVDRAENVFGNIISTSLKYTIRKPKYIRKDEIFCCIEQG